MRLSIFLGAMISIIVLIGVGNCASTAATISMSIEVEQSISGGSATLTGTANPTGEADFAGPGTIIAGSNYKPGFTFSATASSTNYGGSDEHMWDALDGVALTNDLQLAWPSISGSGSTATFSAGTTYNNIPFTTSTPITSGPYSAYGYYASVPIAFKQIIKPVDVSGTYQDDVTISISPVPDGS